MSNSPHTESDTKKYYDTGVIHGRFQVLHNDHVKYLIAGKDLCRHLIVGITNPDPFLTCDEAADPERSTTLANPLTYYERYVIIRAVLEENGIGPEAFSIVPLPINMPERYHFYVPMEAVFFLSIYDDWGQKKLDYFHTLGLTTHILRRVPPEKKGLSAHDIRNLMIAGQAWEHLVPAVVAEYLKRWEIPARLRRIRQDS